MVNASTVSSYFTFQMTKNSCIMSQIKWTCVSEWRPHGFPVWDLTQSNQSYISCGIVVARAARLFFLIQPITSLFSGVAARAAPIFDKEKKNVLDSLHLRFSFSSISQQFSSFLRRDMTRFTVWWNMSASLQILYSLLISKPQWVDL